MGMPLISVCVITYGHEDYIEQCINSILAQQHDFEVEIVIFDDKSPDNTERIVAEIGNSFDSTSIVYHRNEVNLGIIPNLVKALKSCLGKYIAMCDGDDYWTDPLKLAKQVEFLEKNMSYSGYAHNSLVTYEFGDQSAKRYSEAPSGDFELEDLIDRRPFHTASILFRSEITKENEVPSTILSGDKALFLLIACYGKIYYLNEVMCCYRRNDGGISRNVTSDQLRRDFEIGRWIKSINKNFPNTRFMSNVHKSILTNSMQLTTLDLIRHLFYYTVSSFSFFPKNVKNLGGFYFRALPSVLRKLKNKAND